MQRDGRVAYLYAHASTWRRSGEGIVGNQQSRAFGARGWEIREKATARRRLNRQWEDRVSNTNKKQKRVTMKDDSDGRSTRSKRRRPREGGQGKMREPRAGWQTDRAGGSGEARPAREGAQVSRVCFDCPAEASG